jgi:hypothetical protein
LTELILSDETIPDTVKKRPLNHELPLILSKNYFAQAKGLNPDKL